MLQDRVEGINGIFWDNAIKLDGCRSQLSSLVTTTTMDKCRDFINKVTEFRFTKIRDRQVGKSNRLMGNMDRELTTHPLANNNQLQVQGNPNKWIVNLSSTPFPMPKGPFYQKDQIMLWHPKPLI